MRETLSRPYTFQAWRTQNVSRQLGAGKQVETWTPLERKEVVPMSNVVLSEASRQSALRGESTQTCAMIDASPGLLFIIFPPNSIPFTIVPQVCHRCAFAVVLLQKLQKNLSVHYCMHLLPDSKDVYPKQSDKKVCPYIPIVTRCQDLRFKVRCHIVMFCTGTVSLKAKLQRVCPHQTNHLVFVQTY